MRFKADWNRHLHYIRRKEYQTIYRHIFKKLPTKFKNTLDIGAGDCYQTQLLLRHSERITALDYNYDRMLKKKDSNIQQIQGDASRIGTHLKGKKYDLIFSSNLLEHLNDPQSFLKHARKLTTEKGLNIHIMPNSTWKLFQMAFHHLNIILMTLQNARPSRLKKLIKVQKKKIKSDNNPQTQRTYSLVRRTLWPVPHGDYKSNLAELIMYRKGRWINEFNKAGFRHIKVIKGPVCTGYGFGWDRLRSLLERIGLCSEYIYIVRK